MEDHMSYCDVVTSNDPTEWITVTENQDWMIDEQSGEHNSEELLIDLVKNYPHLYDKKHSNFKDAKMKDNSWEEISKILQISVADAKTRWIRLREKFAREKKGIDEDYRSGKEASTRQIWPLYKSLEFLKPYVIGRKTFSNLTNNNVVKAQSTPSGGIQSIEKQIQAGCSQEVGLSENLSRSVDNIVDKKDKKGERKTENQNIDKKPLSRPVKRKYDNVDSSIMNLSAAITSHLGAKGDDPICEQKKEEELFGSLVSTELKKLPNAEKNKKKRNFEDFI